MALKYLSRPLVLALLAIMAIWILWVHLDYSVHNAIRSIDRGATEQSVVASWGHPQKIDKTDGRVVWEYNLREVVKLRSGRGHAAMYQFFDSLGFDLPHTWQVTFSKGRVIGYRPGS